MHSTGLIGIDPPPLSLGHWMRSPAKLSSASADYEYGHNTCSCQMEMRADDDCYRGGPVTRQLRKCYSSSFRTKA